MRRRDIFGLVLTSGLAGCSSVLQSDTRLGGILISNGDDSHHEIDVEVGKDEETVYSAVYQLDPPEEDTADAETVDCEWPIDSGHFVIRARTQQSDWVSIDLSEEDDGDCHQVHVSIPPEFSDNPTLAADLCRDEDSEWLCNSIEF